MIKKVEGDYQVVSEKGKTLSKVFTDKADAIKRLNQIEYFKDKMYEIYNHFEDDSSVETQELKESEYKGKDVTLNKPFRTPKGPKKFAVYVKNDKGNVQIVRFGDPNMEIKRDDPKRRKAYRARHKGDKITDKTKAGYWSWKFWSSKSVSELLKEDL